MPPVSERRSAGRYRIHSAARPGAALAVTAFVAVSAAPPLQMTARAAPQTFVALEYEIAPDATGCPESVGFEASVAHQLGYDPFRAIADRRVAVQIGRRGNAFEGRIRWSDDRGQWVGDRRLSSRRPGCEEIAASLAFSVAVQIQLLATLAPAPEPPPAAPPPPETGPPPPAPAQTEPARPGTSPPPRTRRVRFSAGVGPALGLGLGPQPTGVGRIFVSGRAAWLSLELAVDGAYPTRLEEPDGSGFSLGRFATTTAACGHARAFAACVTGTIGLLEARGFGVDLPTSQAGFFGAVGARLAATRDFSGRFFVAGRLDGLLMLSSWTVRLNETAVWTTPRAGTLVGLDVGVRFF
jgi:hypothetical protein